MKRILSYFLLLALLLAGCSNVSSTPADQPVDDTPAPYSPDTPSPPTIDAPVVESPSLTSIQFLNSLDGWGITETHIVRTTDAGFTWYDVTPPDVTETGYSVQFHAFDPNTAWVLIADFDNYPNSGFLYRTTDGGLTWTNNTTPFSGADLQFLDQNDGWALADLGLAAGSNAVAIYQTNDGGINWTRTFVNDPNDGSANESLPLGGLKFGITPIDMKTAWVYGVTYSAGTVYLFRTDNGGASWANVELPLPEGAEDYELGIDGDQMEFISPTDGFIAMRLTGPIYQLALYVTHDAGNTWTLTPTLIPDGGSADFLSAEEVVVYNGAQFYVTRDAARTWSIIPPDVGFGDMFAMMDFSNTSTGFVLTLDESNQRVLYRSGDGGATWFPVSP